MTDPPTDKLSKEHEKLINMQIGMRLGLGFGLLLVIFAVAVMTFIAQ